MINFEIHISNLKMINIEFIITSQKMGTRNELNNHGLNLINFYIDIDKEQKYKEKLIIMVLRSIIHAR